MTPEELDQLMAECTRQFNDLKVREGSLKEELEGIDTNLKRLQGEYEAYQTLKNTLTERAAAVAQSVSDTTKDPFDGTVIDPAAIVDPKPAKKETSGAAK